MILEAIRRTCHKTIICPQVSVSYSKSTIATMILPKQEVKLKQDIAFGNLRIDTEKAVR